MKPLVYQTIKSEFRLSGESYISSDALSNSEWGAIFAEDIETADCIVIVGLSLDYDLDIKRFIYNQNVVDKTVFIERKGISKDKERKLSRLGKVHSIGMDCFVNALVEYECAHVVKQPVVDTYIYQSFEKNVEKNTSKKATTFQVYDLLMMGQYSDALWYRERGKYINLVYRKTLREVIDVLDKSCRVVFLHANL